MAEEQTSKTNLTEADFMRLLMANEPALRAYARAILPNWSLVDEAIQEASLTIWNKFDQLENEAGFLPWAKVIVRFKCLSQIDKLGRDRHVFSEGILEMLAEESDRLEEKEGWNQSMKALRGCLKGFSEAHQELLLAPYSGEGRVKQIAEAEGKSANALYKLLGRLRGKLADCVNENLKAEAC